MKILVHYPTLLHNLIQFGSRSPLEHIDRLWQRLKTSELQVYISQRGLEIIERDLPDSVSPKVVKRLKKVLHICPRPDVNLAHHWRGDSYEELQEICSAQLMQINYILSSLPYRFHSFGLREFDLTNNIGTILRREHHDSSTLPILLKGDFSDIWFIDNYLKELAVSNPGNEITFRSSLDVLNSTLNKQAT